MKNTEKTYKVSKTDFNKLIRYRIHPIEIIKMTEEEVKKVLSQPNPLDEEMKINK